jgi:membrane protein implicated in regulation of membrane protease activity
MSDRGSSTGGPVAQAAAAAGGIALAGGITAVVLMVVGASLLIAGAALMAGIALAGVSLPFVVAGKRSRESLRARPKPRIIDTHATSRQLTDEPAAAGRDKVKDVLDRLEAGDVSSEQALDDLK